MPRSRSLVATLRPGVCRMAIGAMLMVCLGATVAPARAADDVAPYRPIPAEIGAAVVPPPALLATTARLREAAAAKDGDAVAGLLAARLVFVSSGITVDTRRSAETLTAWKTPDQALEAIGSHYQEGDLPLPGRAHLRPSASDFAFEVIVELLDGADWGRDPLVPGSICSHRGGRWSALAGAAAGVGMGGLWVGESTEVRASASEDAEIVARLRPNRIYLEGFLEDRVEGWRGVRLPRGGVGAVPETKLHLAQTSGICFSAKTGGGWVVSGFASARL